MEELFKKFKKSALRLETFPEYKDDMNEDDYHNFILGKPLNYADVEWINNVKQWTEQGKIIKRIRIISEDLTTYEKYEFLCYNENNLAGEKILVVPRTEYEKLVNKQDRFDYWIFDESIVCKINYNENGCFIGCEIIKENSKKYIDIFHSLEKKVVFDCEKVISQINNSKIKIKF